MANRELELSTDPVDEPTQELITFFTDDLGEVSFPDTDGGSLDAAALEQLADKVRRGAAEVQRARKALEEANQALASARDELDDKAVRALGYAKVFCQGQPPLLEKVSALSLGGAKRKPKAKKQKATEGKAAHSKAAPSHAGEPKAAPAKKAKKKEPTALPLQDAPRGKAEQSAEAPAEVKAA